MSRKNEHTNTDHLLMGDHFFINGTFRWKKTQEEVWAEMDEKINSSAPTKVRKLYFDTKAISIAASIAILVGVVSFLRFYSTSTATLAGIHQTAILPDGSQVHLNAESKLSYYPLWWKVKRIMNFEGEGFFQVQKGNRFIVQTRHGNVEVLGTSFNVFARHEALKVTCVTGSVKVTSKHKKHVILKPNTKVELLANNDLKLIEDSNLDYDLAWRNNNFRFESEPLKNVFLEIERQYGINIEMDFSTSAIYSGNFYKKDSVENILDYVCSAMGLTFKQKSDNEYIVSQE